ncbi:hypothetical protein BCU83_04195 [Vibrio breoganii]|uniref:PD-(D/E)XK nuclease family protein n=1 Tax=Vibrio breoganii TaxID=553239 RepID=UPI000C860A20|nr:PD-(D/E)XK nuclease family protein [Vibrio breoganii]PMG86418.1 hypothetical protein BCU83_04195 [Vibrio breoganii]
MDSLLVNVSKYASSDKKAPIENFITEAFAWLLKNDIEVTQKVLNLIEHKLAHKVPLSEFEKVEIDTQVNFSGVYPDMMLTFEHHDLHLVFEHKVWSELHENQLDNYRNYATTNFKDHRIVLITAISSQHQQDYDVALCWSEIADAIKSIKASEDKTQWLREEFIALLKDNGLLDITPINPLVLSYYKEALLLDGQLLNIGRASLNRNWYLSTLEDQFFICSDKVRNAWGRIGIEFITSTSLSEEAAWAPAIFCGFIKDGSDHLVEELMPRGPIAALVMSISSSLHKQVRHELSYSSLVEELSSKLRNQSLWKLSDRTKEKEYNPWHPLIIYCDVSKLYENTNSTIEQEQIFEEHMDQLQRWLVECPSFESFCKAMKTKSEISS